MQPPSPKLPPVRVLQLCAVDFTVRQFVAPVALALGAAGARVQCACTPGPHWDELAEMGVDMVAMPIARSANPVRAARSVGGLVRWLRTNPVDVLHVHTPVAAMIGRLAGRIAGVPLIIYTAHGFYFHDEMPAGKRRVHVALEWAFGRLNQELFCVSSEDAAAAVRLGIARRENVHYVGNGAAPGRFDPGRFTRAERFALRDRLGIPGEATVVVITGRLVREKGYLELLEAARALAPRHPGLHVLLVGDTVASEHDDAKKEILRAAEAAELRGRVHFAGLRRDIPELLHASDVFCLPTYREGMPVSILEAMMMGLPVVATRIRGCREEVVDGETGFLVAPRRADQVAGALDYLVGSAEARAAFGAAGRARALEHFDERKVLRQQVVLYRRLLKKHGIVAKMQEAQRP